MDEALLYSPSDSFAISLATEYFSSELELGSLIFSAGGWYTASWGKNTEKTDSLENNR